MKKFDIHPREIYWCMKEKQGETNTKGEIEYDW